jgi:hypothetical protein
MPMMAMTTNSSTKVKPRFEFFIVAPVSRKDKKKDQSVKTN